MKMKKNKKLEKFYKILENCGYKSDYIPERGILREHITFRKNNFSIYVSDYTTTSSISLLDGTEERGSTFDYTEQSVSDILNLEIVIMSNNFMR